MIQLRALTCRAFFRGVHQPILQNTKRRNKLSFFFTHPSMYIPTINLQPLLATQHIYAGLRSSESAATVHFT